ncbi:Uncharacterized protein ChrSV_4078 [Chromobacterium vaccinii]|nr:Uncharacterized protein ChrSW_4078 [Chromobacterium vaccinii]QND91535.1 Uncharacterized protein ChrSV_4078 [Chromobacterium vaccinii]
MDEFQDGNRHCHACGCAAYLPASIEVFIFKVLNLNNFSVYLARWVERCAGKLSWLFEYD